MIKHYNSSTDISDLGKLGSPDTEYFVDPEQILGKGAYGDVYKITCKRNVNRVFAMKYVSCEISDLDPSKDVLNEMRLMRVLRHENIPRLAEVYYEMTDTTIHTFLIMEYIPGYSLERYSHLNKSREGQIPMEQLKVVIKCVLKALKYLHSLNVIHRDIKPGNIMVMNESGESKLIDLGQASPICAISAVLEEYMGTPYYAAPEMLFHWSYDKSVDIWSLGVVLWDMFAVPHKDTSSFDNLARNLYDSRSLGGCKPFAMIPFLDSLISKLAAFHPSDRLSADEALSHRWLLEN